MLEFAGPAGRAYPPNSTSTDLWFQHIAIVVNDMTDAYQRVMANPRFRPISRHGPVQLPEESGGVAAFKFRDHDGHPLELLAFPPGRIPPAWRGTNGASPFLGIDHTAVAVSHLTSSTRFFSSVFGFTIGTRTENRGPEQAALDDVEDVHVSVTRLAPDLPAPRLELLRYHVGPRRRNPGRHSQQRHRGDALRDPGPVARPDRRGAGPGRSAASRQRPDDPARGHPGRTNRRARRAPLPGRRAGGPRVTPNSRT